MSLPGLNGRIGLRPRYARQSRLAPAGRWRNCRRGSVISPSQFGAAVEVLASVDRSFGAAARSYATVIKGCARKR